MRVLAVAAVSIVVASSAQAKTAPQLRDPTWSADGARLAYVRTSGATGRVYVVGADGRSPRALAPSQALPYGLTWSPDGGSLAYASAGDIWRVDLANGRRARLTNAPSLAAYQPAWSPDGATIAYTVFEGCFRCTRIYAIDAADGGNRRLLADGVRRPEWSGDGTQILTSLPVRLVTVATGASETVAGGASAAWSGDHSTYIYVGDGGLYMPDPGTAQPRLVWPSVSVFAYPTLSPRGARIAAVRTKSILVGELSGPKTRLPRADSANDAPAWSIRGTLAYVADGSCGARSEIDIARSDGSKAHAFLRTCR